MALEALEDDFDDGLSDVSEDVTMAIDDTDFPQRLRQLALSKFK